MAISNMNTLFIDPSTVGEKGYEGTSSGCCNHESGRINFLNGRGLIPVLVTLWSE